MGQQSSMVLRVVGVVGVVVVHGQGQMLEQLLGHVGQLL